MVLIRINPPSPPSLSQVKRVFASLANGTLCVFSCKSISAQQDLVGYAKHIPEACIIKCDEEFRVEAEDWADPLILKLAESSKSAKCMVFVGNDRLWCGCGNTITVVDSVNLKVLHNIPVFVKRMALVNELVSNGDKVWGVGRQLSCVMEWDSKTYSLLHVFNCNDIDPTDENIISDPKQIEDLIDPEKRDKAATIASPPTDKDISESESESESKEPEGFQVVNNPVSVSVTTNTPFSQRGTRQTLRGVGRRPRGKAMSKEFIPRERVVGSTRVRLKTLRDRVLRRHQGSTRTTSLVLVDKTLWVARGMGDILVIDIRGEKDHGRVLARLATDESEKYGNRSYHKLAYVAKEYVVSSQWLEPVDIRRGSVQPLSSFIPQDNGRPATTLADKFSEPQIIAHQAITIWDAWNHERISNFMMRRAAMLMQEDEDSV